MKTIKYRSGYKYQLADEYTQLTLIRPEKDVIAQFYSIETTGLVTARRGYCWDGATGAVDSQNFMRGSLIHDIGCQAINEGLLDRKHKAQVDKELILICAEDGMSKLRQRWVYWAVKKWSCSDKFAHPVLESPRK